MRKPVPSGNVGDCDVRKDFFRNRGNSAGTGSERFVGQGGSAGRDGHGGVLMDGRGFLVNSGFDRIGNPEDGFYGPRFGQAADSVGSPAGNRPERPFGRSENSGELGKKFDIPGNFRNPRVSGNPEQLTECGELGDQYGRVVDMPSRVFRIRRVGEKVGEGVRMDVGRKHSDDVVPEFSDLKGRREIRPVPENESFRNRRVIVPTSVRFDSGKESERGEKIDGRASVCKREGGAGILGSLRERERDSGLQYRIGQPAAVRKKVSTGEETESLETFGTVSRQQPFAPNRRSFVQFEPFALQDPLERLFPVARGHVEPRQIGRHEEVSGLVGLAGIPNGFGMFPETRFRPRDKSRGIGIAQSVGTEIRFHRRADSFSEKFDREGDVSDSDGKRIRKSGSPPRLGQRELEHAFEPDSESLGPC